MSLINDALKRAKQAQHQAAVPSAPAPPFRSAVDEPPVRRGFGAFVPAVLAVVALLALFLIWRVAGKGDSAKLAALPSQTVPSKPEAPAAVSPAIAPQPNPPEPSSAPASPVATSPAASGGASPLAASQEGASTNSGASVEPALPKPAPLKLQGIIYNPRRPSAVISGKTVFIGESVGELRVVAITQSSATLIGAGQTNILNLSE